MGSGSEEEPTSGVGKAGERNASGFKCSKCQNTFKRKDGLDRHIKTQHDESFQPLKCPVKDCQAERFRKDHLRTHIYQAHKLDPSQVLPNSKPMVGRSITEDPTQKLKCPCDRCDVDFSRRDNLYRHIRNVHEADPQEVLGEEFNKRPRPSSSGKGFMCLVSGCKAELSTRAALYRHLRSVHKVEPQEILGDVFKNRTTSSKSSKRRSKKKRESSSDEEEDDDSAEERNNLLEDSSHFEDQPNSSFSDDEIGASTGEGVVKEEVHEEIQLDEDVTLCVLCCYPFYYDDDIKQQNTSQFKNFISEIIPGQDENATEQLPVCTSCHPLINSAMERKLLVNEIEITIRKLEQKILHEKQKLSGALVEYFHRMKKIEKVVSAADVSTLKAYLQRNMLENKTDDNSLVLLLRDGIVSAIKKLENTKEEMKTSSGGEPPAKKRKRQPSSEIVKSEEDESSLPDGPLIAEELLITKELGDNDTKYDCHDDHEKEYNLRKRKSAPNDEEDSEKGEDDEEYVPDAQDNDDRLSESDDEDFYASSQEIAEGSDSGSSVSEMDDKGRKSDGDVVLNREKIQSFLNTSKPRTTKKLNRCKLMKGVDISGWTKFRITLLKIIKRQTIRKNRLEKSASNSEENSVPDPRLNFLLEYTPETDTFNVGGIPLIVHDQEECLECTRCSHRAFKNIANKRTAGQMMQMHVQQKHLPVFQCPHCPSKLGSFHRYAEHVTGHKGSIVCDKCEQVFVREISLTRHTWSYHMTQEEREEAIRQGQTDPRVKKKYNNIYQCATCGKSYTQPNNLRLHERIHSENHKVESCLCSNCGNSFVGKHTLLFHQKYSCFPPGQEPLRVKCDQCPRDFKNKYLLARHLKANHSSAAVEKPFRCDVCGVGFSTNASLTRHMISHSDERPYECRRGCGGTFKQSKHLSRHEKICNGVLKGNGDGRRRRATTGHDEQDMKVDFQNYFRGKM